MNIDHDDYLELQGQLQDHFDGRYRQIKDCDDKVSAEEKKIGELQDKYNDVRVELAKTNTRLGIVIAILSAIAVPILALCVKLLFS
jgi:hypothetical protein